ncbi:MAG: hypothetical protein L0219_20985, partial [Phycisphaerales bacterium]|nr:hypothetical protein [Phycisphaerales bacterium]
SEREHNQPAGVILASADRVLPVDVKVYDFVTWLEARGVFLLQSDTNLIAITPSGAVKVLPVPDGLPYYRISPDGQWVLWGTQNLDTHAQQALIAVWGQEPRPILDEFMNFDIWMPNSQRVYFSMRDGFYYAELPDFEPVVIDPQFSGWPLGWIEP